MSFRVVLTVRDLPDVPGWVREQLAESGIDFAARNCKSADDFLALAAEADAVWTMGVNSVITPETLAKLPRCKAVMRSGSGVDGLPVEAATRLGIWVANTPESIAESVADHAIALLFAVVRQIPFYDAAVRRNEWFTHGTARIRWHLSGQTLGLVGFGQIARHVAAKLVGFRLNRMAFDPFVAPEAMAEAGVRAAPLEAVLAESDFVSVHCPLTEQTRRLIGAPQLARMKPGSILINTSRGGVIDEPALAEALEKGPLGGAGLDVLEREPPPADHPLLRSDRVVLSPHTAAFSDEFDRKFWECSVAAIRDFQRGRFREHSVNRPAPR